MEPATGSKRREEPEDMDNILDVSENEHKIDIQSVTIIFVFKHLQCVYNNFDGFNTTEDRNEMN